MITTIGIAIARGMMSNSLILTFFAVVLAIGNHPSDRRHKDGGAVSNSEFQPEFVKPLENITVPVGRDATFTCTVRGLGGYRVGWVKADSKAIQAIHTHVITHNPRVFVSHSDHTMWHLHIKSVKEEDRGSYMCQINSDPMISSISYLDVVIPPDFIPEETSGDLMAPEGSTVKLTCNAKGQPQPKITWKRENDQNITLKSPSGAKTQVASYEGNILRLLKVSRADMGAYLCIATNGVPPTISKRIMVSVHFHPVIHVPNQLVGAPVNTDVTLECNVEAFPRSIHFWTKDRGTSMIISTDRYEVKEIVKSMFEVKMLLTIRKFRRSDSGAFECIAKNSLGDVQSGVKLHALDVPNENEGGDKLSKSPGNALVYDNEEDGEEYEEEEESSRESSVVVTRLPESINPYYKNSRGGTERTSNINNRSGGQGYNTRGDKERNRDRDRDGSGRHSNKNAHNSHINNNKHGVFGGVEAGGGGGGNNNNKHFQNAVIVNADEMDTNSDSSASRSLSPLPYIFTLLSIFFLLQYYPPPPPHSSH